MAENIDIRVREDGSREVSRNIRDIGAAADESVAKSEKLTGTFKEQMSSINNLNTSYGNATAALREMNQQVDTASTNMTKASGSTSSFTQSLKDIAAGAVVFDLVTNAISNLVDRLMAIPRAALDAVQAILQVQAGADQLRIGLNAAAGGDKAQGSRDFDFLNELVQKLGLNLKATGDQFMKFQAAVAGTTLEGQKAQAVFTAISEAAVTLHLNQQQTAGAFLALEQMASKGTVSMEELRRQLGNAIPGAMKLAAEAMGVTQGELTKMIQSGQVLAEDFLPKFGEAVRKHYGEASIEAAEGAQAALNRFETAWLQLKRTIVESGLGDAAKGQLSILTDGVNAVTEAMARAKMAGSGFFGQAGAGLWAASGFLNPTQLFGYRAQSEEGRQTQLKQYNAELEKGNLTYQQRLQIQFNISQLQKQSLDYQKQLQALRPPGQGDVRAVDQQLAQSQQREAEAATARARTYADNGGKHLSRAQNHVKALNDIKKEFDAATKGVDQSSKEYADALASYNDRVAAENEKYDKPFAAQAARDNEQSIRQQLAVWQGYYNDRENMLKTSITNLETLRNNGEITEKQFIQRRLDEQINALTDEQAVAEKQAEIASGSKNLAMKEKYLNEVKALNDKIVQAEADAEKDVSAIYKRLNQSTQNALVNLQAYNEQLNRSNQTTLSGIGRGSQQQSDAQALDQIRKRYEDQSKALTKQATQAGVLDSSEYADGMAKINDLMQEQLKREQDFFDQRNAMQADWSNGAVQAWQNYANQASNVASTVSSAFTNGFKGMEDSLVTFVTTGKLDFTSFVTSVMADLARMEIRILLSKVLSSIFGMFAGSMFGSSSSASTSISTGGGLGSSFSVGDQSSFVGYSGTGMFASNATGGSTYSNQPTWVGENGRELWVPPGNGVIVPNDVLGKSTRSMGTGGGTFNVQVVNNMGGQAAVKTQQGQDNNGNPTLKVLIDAVKGDIANEISSGRGDVTKAIAGTFGTNPKPRGG